MSTQPWRKRTLFLQSLLAESLLACGNDDDDIDEVAHNACLQYSASGAVYNPGTPGQAGAPEIATGIATKKVA